MNLKLKSFSVLPALKKAYSKYGAHVIFGVVLLILLIYVGVVIKINRLANAEPDPSQNVVITNAVPHIDSKAVKQIQALEDNNTDVHSLFEQARNNPFSE